MKSIPGRWKSGNKGMEWGLDKLRGGKERPEWAWKRGCEGSHRASTTGPEVALPLGL